MYNIDDNIAKIYYPNITGDELKGIAFKYNKDKWITEIDGLLSGDDAAAIRKYEYYSDGKISCIKDFQNFLNKDSDYVERDYSYDVFDRVLSMKYYNSTNKDLILEQYDYEYDKNSNITYKHEKYNYSNNLKDEDVTYTYNKLNQLVESVKNNKLTYKTITSSYSYDSVGNRTYEKIIKKDTVATDKTFDEATYNYYSYNRLNQLSGKTEVITDGTTTKTYTGSYKYDARGNQIEVTDGKSKTNTKYTYDVENQLTDVEVTTDGKKTGEQHNIYNGNGQRISKTDIVIDGDNKKSNTTCYFYEGSLLLYTTDDSGKKISQNVIGNQDNIIVGIRYSGGNQNEYFYAKDVQGSITNITDNTGACVQSYDYTDFGETAQRIATDFENEICYTGGIYDELTGLYYLNARYYNPDEGVFLSQDTYRGTEKNAECWNLYAYCANNPINYVDPSGHTAEVVLYSYGAVNWWNPSGWVTLGAAVIISGSILYATYAGTKYITEKHRMNSNSKVNKNTRVKKSLKFNRGRKGRSKNGGGHLKDRATSKGFNVKDKGRIDVEYRSVNSEKTGIHYHTPKGKKYYLHKTGEWLTREGDKPTKSIKKIMNSDIFKATLKKAIEYLGK